jgi:hypothetical protein
MNKGTPLGVRVQQAGTAAVLNVPTAERYLYLFLSPSFFIYVFLDLTP